MFQPSRCGRAMESASLEVFIRQHCPWEQLPAAVRLSFENNRALWEKEVCAFSLKNQLPWRTSLVRKLYPDERKYYTEMLRTSRERLMVRLRRASGRAGDGGGPDVRVLPAPRRAAAALPVPPGRVHRADAAHDAVPLLPRHHARAHAPRAHLRHPAQLYRQGLYVAPPAEAPRRPLVTGRPAPPRPPPPPARPPRQACSIWALAATSTSTR